MKKEDWKRIEEALSPVFAEVEIAVKGARIRLRKGPVSMNRLGIMTYVNGELKAEWFSKECLERKCMRPKLQYVYIPKDRAILVKLGKTRAGRKALRDRGVDPNAKIRFYGVVWNNVDQIRRHYEKTFDLVSLVSLNGEIVYGVPDRIEVKDEH